MQWSAMGAGEEATPSNKPLEWTDRRLVCFDCNSFMPATQGQRSKDQQSKISACICFVVAILSLYAVGKQLREC